MAWNLKQKAQDHIVLVLFGLITLLLLIVWRAVDPSVWGKVSEVTPKRALWALLGLAGIAICLLSGALIDNWRKKKQVRPEMLKRFGVLWDADLNPHCPTDQILMRPRSNLSDRDHEIMMCPKCDHTYPLRTNDLLPLRLPAAQSLIRHELNPSMLPPEPKLLKQFGVLWDEAQQPHCPVDRTLLFIWSHEEADRDGPACDTLKCPKCDVTFPVRDERGLRTLFEAKNFIRDHLRRGLISN